eukprot:m.70240 g.70240  ORF g.70240 m.70240 type:complete len:55 (+) comp12252_c0_seq3:3696-3860(+)
MQCIGLQGCGMLARSSSIFPIGTTSHACLCDWLEVTNAQIECLCSLALILVLAF